MADKVSIVLFSGTEDKLMAASIIASGAVANNMDVDIFVTFWGLTKAMKNPPLPPNVSFDGQMMKDQMFALMKEKNMPDWISLINNAKEVGNIKVYGCALFADMMQLKKEDLNPIIDEIIGVNEFVSISKDSMTLFI